MGNVETGTELGKGVWTLVTPIYNDGVSLCWGNGLVFILQMSSSNLSWNTVSPH